MIDLFPDLGFVLDVADSVVVWAAAFGSGFYVHKKSAINYKERWKGALQTLKDEQLNTKELEEAVPPPTRKLKPSNHFEPAGNHKEFQHLGGLERIHMERERLAQGLPPKDSMRGNHLYHVIASERIKQGWDWDEDDNGWYWRKTTTQHKLEEQYAEQVKSAYSKGYSDAASRRTGYSDHDYDWKKNKYKKLMRDSGMLYSRYDTEY